MSGYEKVLSVTMIGFLFLMVLAFFEMEHPRKEIFWTIFFGVILLITSVGTILNWNG
ncbi:MAG: hypothetical protein PHS04_08925 [Tissierellia bacterium]|jgi:hypothetical protein|nr:hypothetical protein [Tissierellia bacterium]